MKNSVFSFAFVFTLLAAGIVAQDPAPPPDPPPVEKAQHEEQALTNPCPRMTLKAPTQPVRDGSSIRLTVSLSGGDKKVDPIFDWSISAGTIRTGQGTASIEVDTSGAGADRSIHATLLIGGYSAECSSSETAVVPIAGPARIGDEFGSLPESEFAARIETFTATVPNGDQVYVIAYAGRSNVRGYASSTLRQIRSVALRSGVSSDRLVTIDGGYREQAAFEFWIVPVGAEAPTPTPTLNAREIVFPKAAASMTKSRKP